MISYAQKLSCYDVAAAGTFLGTLLIVGPSLPLLSPLYVAPFVISSAIKTAYHGLQFFRLQQNPPKLDRDSYMKRERVFRASNLNDLQHHLNIHSHRQEMHKAFKSTLNRAKGLIPVVGLIWWIFTKTPPTSLKPKDTWTDVNALKYHIKYLTLPPQK